MPTLMVLLISLAAVPAGLDAAKRALEAGDVDGAVEALADPALSGGPAAELLARTAKLAVEKKDSAVAKEIEAKLAEKKAAAPAKK